MENRNIENVKKVQNTLENYSQVNEPLPLVIVANESGNAAETQPSFPKPNRKQRLRYSIIYVGGTNTYFQIATPSATKNIYFVGHRWANFSATTPNLQIWDAASGNVPSFSANTMYEEGSIVLFPGTATVGSIDSFFPPLPIKVTQGLRFNGGAASVAAYMIIYYIEETIDSRSA